MKRILAIVLPLAGCADVIEVEGAEGLAAGVVGLAALFVFLLFAVPPVQDYLRRREHRDRMVNRRPWSPEDAKRTGSGRRKDA